MDAISVAAEYIKLPRPTGPKHQSDYECFGNKVQPEQIALLEKEEQRNLEEFATNTRRRVFIITRK